MSTPSSDEQEAEMRVFRHLFGIAGMTEQDVTNLIHAAGVVGKVPVTPEDYAKVPPVPELADLLTSAARPGDSAETLADRTKDMRRDLDRRTAQAQRLAQAHAMIRIALAEKARRRETQN
jgi:hypothetical protein